MRVCPGTVTTAEKKAVPAMAATIVSLPQVCIAGLSPLDATDMLRGHMGHRRTTEVNGLAVADRATLPPRRAGSGNRFRPSVAGLSRTRPANVPAVAAEARARRPSRSLFMVLKR